MLKMDNIGKDKLEQVKSLIYQIEYLSSSMKLSDKFDHDSFKFMSKEMMLILIESNLDKNHLAKQMLTKVRSILKGQNKQQSSTPGLQGVPEIFERRRELYLEDLLKIFEEFVELQNNNYENLNSVLSSLGINDSKDRNASGKIYMQAKYESKVFSLKNSMKIDVLTKKLNDIIQRDRGAFDLSSASSLSKKGTLQDNVKELIIRNHELVCEINSGLQSFKANLEAVQKKGDIISGFVLRAKVASKSTSTKSIENNLNEQSTDYQQDKTASTEIKCKYIGVKDTNLESQINHQDKFGPIAGFMDENNFIRTDKVNIVAVSDNKIVYKQRGAFLDIAYAGDAFYYVDYDNQAIFKKMLDEEPPVLWMNFSSENLIYRNTLKAAFHGRVLIFRIKKHKLLAVEILKNGLQGVSFTLEKVMNLVDYQLTGVNLDTLVVLTTEKLLQVYSINLEHKRFDKLASTMIPDILSDKFIETGFSMAVENKNNLFLVRLHHEREEVREIPGRVVLYKLSDKNKLSMISQIEFDPSLHYYDDVIACSGILGNFVIFSLLTHEPPCRLITMTYNLSEKRLTLDSEKCHLVNAVHVLKLRRVKDYLLAYDKELKKVIIRYNQGSQRK